MKFGDFGLRDSPSPISGSSEWKVSTTDMTITTTGHVRVDALDEKNAITYHFFQTKKGEEVKVSFGDTWIVVTVRLIEGDVTRRFWIAKADRILNVQNIES